MREFLIIIICLVGFHSCKYHKMVKTKECKSYYTFLQNNWIKNNDFTYSFKGDPSYWNNDIYIKYVKDECLIGLKKKDIRSFLGHPTKEYKSPKLNIFIYCFEESCLLVDIYEGKRLIFYFNSNNEVENVDTSPAASNIPDY